MQRVNMNCQLSTDVYIVTFSFMGFDPDNGRVELLIELILNPIFPATPLSASLHLASYSRFYNLQDLKFFHKGLNEYIEEIARVGYSKDSSYVFFPYEKGFLFDIPGNSFAAYEPSDVEDVEMTFLVNISGDINHLHGLMGGTSTVTVKELRGFLQNLEKILAYISHLTDG